MIIVFIYSAVKLPVCLNKLTYLLTYRSNHKSERRKYYKEHQ